MESSLRPVQSGEWRSLWEIDQACFDPTVAYDQVEFRRLLALRDSFHLAAEADGKIAGFLMSALDRGRGHIITIDILPHCRRLGLGLALMNAAEQHYRELPGAVGMRLEVATDNAAALAFYDRLGYRLFRRLPGYYARGKDALLLQKTW